MNRDNVPFQMRVFGTGVQSFLRYAELSARSCPWQLLKSGFSSFRNFLPSAFSGKFKQGVYAVSVSGRLPGAVIRDLQRSGVTYRSRDTSKR